MMYGIGGERDLSERDRPTFRVAGQAPGTGWATAPGTRRQLDVYGELLDAAATLPEYLNDLEPGTRQFLADAADAAASLLAVHGSGHLGGPRRSPALPSLES